MNIAIKSLLQLAIGAFSDNKSLDIIITAIGEGQYLVFLRKSRYSEKVVSIVDERPEVACVNALPSRHTEVTALSVLLNSYLYDTSNFPPEKLKEVLDEVLNKK